MVNRVDRINGLVGSIAVKAPVRVATSNAITLSGAQTIASVSLNADATPRERVLVKDQASDIDNGIYDVNSGAWTRSPDFDGSRDAVDGTQVLVNEGLPFVRTYYLSADNPVAIGTDPLVFVAIPIEVTELENNFYYPDYLANDHGVTGSDNTIKYYVDLLNGDAGTIYLRHNSGSATTTYTLTTSETIPKNVILEIETGAIIDGAGTLTFEGENLEARFQEIFGSSITVLGLQYAYPEWWKDNTTPLTTEMADAINAATTASRALRLSGSYKVLSQVSIGLNKEIECIGPVVIRGDYDAFDVSDGNRVLQVGSTVITQIAELDGNVSKEDQTIDFASAHSLSQDDILCIYNPTDYSWSSARTSYRAGEFCRVSVVTDADTVVLDSGLYDDYVAASVDVYKMTMGTFAVKGKLSVYASKPTSGEATYAISLSQIVDSEISGLSAYAYDGAYTALLLHRCYNLTLTGVTNIQEVLSGHGGDYGLSCANSQHITASGYFTASRHGITLSGFGTATDVPNRDCHFSGTVKTTNEGSVQAFSCHGNTEDISMTGIVYGGITPGGKGFKFRGTCYGDNRGLCVVATETKSFTHDFAHSRHITDKNPFVLASGRGVIDFGFGSAFDVDNMEAGTLKLNDIIIDAPNAERGVAIRRRNTTVVSGAKMNIDLRNSTINTLTDADTYPIWLDDFGGAQDFNKIMLEGLTFTGDYPRLANYTELHCYTVKGVNTYTTNLAQRVTTSSPNFSPKFPLNYVPQVKVDISNYEVGSGDYVVGLVGDVTYTGFTMKVITVDAANFSVADQYPWYYRAS